MEHAVDRRQLLKAGAGVAAGAAAASVLGGVVAADVAHAAPKIVAIGSVGIERLWGATSKTVRVGGKKTIVKTVKTKGLYGNTANATLNKGGLCHWVGTPQPFAKGNCVLFGHRTAAGGPLRNTHKMKVGDEIILKVGVTQKTYVVMTPTTPATPGGVYEIIGKRDFAKAINWGDSNKSNITLVGCTKPNGLPTSKDFRILIRATEKL